MKILSKIKDLGDGFTVARCLPTAQKRSLGPFVFIDHMGPVKVDLKKKLDVRPHPHIGLATVTYLYDGVGLHRDSLGHKQIIKPGDINWMTAGRGIVHSERTPEEVFKAHTNEQTHLHGLQVWVALPENLEDCDPSFVHHSASEIPFLKLNSSVQARLLIGEYNNQKSPVKADYRIIYIDFEFTDQATIEIKQTEDEFGFYVVQGSGQINGEELLPKELYVPENSAQHTLTFNKGSRVALFGGEKLQNPRYMWWNFVSSSVEKIKIAADLWKEQKMGKVPEETDYIPLPNDPLPAKRN